MYGGPQPLMPRSKPRCLECLVTESPRLGRHRPCEECSHITGWRSPQPRPRARNGAVKDGGKQQHSACAAYLTKCSGQQQVPPNKSSHYNLKNHSYHYLLSFFRTKWYIKWCHTMPHPNSWGRLCSMNPCINLKHELRSALGDLAHHLHIKMD